MKLYVKEKVTGLKITSARDVFDTIKELGKIDQESVWVIGYDSGNKEVFRGCIFLGGLNSAIIDLKILFKRVLVAGCASFILIHNHPSGEIKPSLEDKKVTEKIKQAAQLLEINFLDHIIIGEDSFFSFMEDGTTL